MHRRFVFLLAWAIVALGVATSPALAGLAGGGNSGSAKLCQKGGWQDLQTGNGGHFASQSDCVSYAAGGGTLFQPEVTATDLGCSSAIALGFDVWRLDAVGFTPLSTETLNGVLLPNRHFDSTGGTDGSPIYFIPNNAGVMLTLTLLDGSGVTASVTFGPTLSCS